VKPSSLAEIVYGYLAHRTMPHLRPADIIVGFGHFDRRVAQRCGELWQAGLAPRILFTGGVGAGSADLDQPEAEAFAQTLLREYPSFPHEHLIIEPESTHTGDNIRFSLGLIAAARWSVHSAILVATPFRQQRVRQTWAKVTPSISQQSAPPLSSLDTDIEVFAQKGEDLIAQLLGEIQRLRAYPAKGWICSGEIPEDVTAAIRNL